MNAVLLLVFCEEEGEGAVRDGEGVETSIRADCGVGLEAGLVVAAGARADGSGDEVVNSVGLRVKVGYRNK